MATRQAIMDGLAIAIWEHASVQAFGPRQTMRSVPAAAEQCAGDLEKLYLKMNCVEALQSMATMGADFTRRGNERTEDRDYGYRLGRAALGLPIQGHLPTALTPTFTIKYDGKVLSWDGEIDLGIEGNATTNPGRRQRGNTTVWQKKIGNLMYKVEQSRNDRAAFVLRTKHDDDDEWSVYDSFPSAAKAIEFAKTHGGLENNPPILFLNPHEWPSSEIQSLIFDVREFTVAQAKDWAKEHGYRYGSVDTTGSYHRLRQEAPQGGPCRTVEFTKGVRAIVCAVGRGLPPGVPEHGGG